jgi:hypothetical protein
MLIRSVSRILVVAVAFAVGGFPAVTGAGNVDLSDARIVVSDTAPVRVKAAEMLQEEIAKRTGVTLAIVGDFESGQRPHVVLGTADEMPRGCDAYPGGLAVPEQAEGFALWVAKDNVYLVGRNDRGALFAAGRLLRELRLREGRVALAKSTRIATAPRYPVRGHELGYRGKSNTYDAWNLDQYEQYIRDLIVFGANTVQLIPTVDPDELPERNMPVSVWEMTAALTELIGSYGLDVWLWVPLLDDVRDPTLNARSLEQRHALFEACSSIDVVFVPGGDPGHTPPEILLPWSEKLAGVLRTTHPDAELWVSNEAFPHAWNDYLFDYLVKEDPDWLSGVVFGTWTKIPFAEERARVPKRYPIVRYADITHCVRCQYPIPAWDRAFARTLEREPINTIPRASRHIHNLFAPLSVGFVTYSDGVNDDVNKVVWTAMGWDPDADLNEVLRDYGRYFMGDEYGKAAAKGLLALEENWRGPLLGNKHVTSTLRHWQALEKQGGEGLLGSWRFQMGLFRAYYDEYVHLKLEAETALEDRALAILTRAESLGSERAVADARAVLASATDDADTETLRARVIELGETLFQAIGMQMSVEKYGAQSQGRGAVLDALDRPLNNRTWLEAGFEKVLADPDEKVRLEYLASIVNWEDPGPGGFYDDPGDPTKEPHLVRQKTWDGDPSFVQSPQDEHRGDREGQRLSWLDQAQTLYGTPLRMRYENLDAEAHYMIRVVYAGRFRATMRLVADGQYEIHGPLAQPDPVQPVEFDVPVEATRDGVLDLEWQLIEQRGCQVGEIWLIRKND